MSTPQSYEPDRHAPQPREPAQRAETVPWGEVLIFLALAVGLCSLVCLAFWLTGQETLFGFRPGPVAMFTPAIAVFIVVFWVRRPRSIPRATSLWPLRPAGRVAGYCLVALLFSVLLGFAVVLLAAVLGMVDLDLQNFSKLRQGMAEMLPGFDGADGHGFPAVAPFLFWVLLQFLSVLPLLVFSFGEEYGWRGYLLPKLLPRGVWVAILLNGLIWVVWHLPILLLARDYTGPGDFAVHLALFTVGRALPQVVVICWLRLASGSVWPAVVMHASAPLTFAAVTIPAEAGTAVNPAFHVAGQEIRLVWFLMAAFAVLLAVTRQLRPRPGDPALPVAPRRRG